MHDNLAATPQSRRVVIADDEALPAELLRRLVTRLGHTVVGVASDGAEVVELARQLRPDVILLDLRMPRLDGWSAATAIMREAPTALVVVSALDDRASLQQAAQAGVGAFLVKPVREDDLARALEIATARFADLQTIQKWKTDAEAHATELASQNEELARLLAQLRQAQAQLLSAARRATVASLAQGMAHEINNALTPIIGHAQMLELESNDKPDMAQRAEQIVLHARRIASLTASFRHYTVESRDEVIPFSFNGIIRDVLDLYRERFERAGVRLNLQLEPDLPVVEGHPDQIQEVIVNVVQNALEAMPRGGDLKVTTGESPAAARVFAEVVDTGIGISPENLPLLFEPGFTTRVLDGRQAGFGWGLFIARQIVGAHRGEIEITSEPARHAPGGERQATRGDDDGAHGTTVRISLPVADGSNPNFSPSNF